MGQAESAVMHLRKLVVLSQLGSVTDHCFSKTDTADLGELQKGIEYNHSDEVFSETKERIQRLSCGKKMISRGYERQDMKSGEQGRRQIRDTHGCL